MKLAVYFNRHLRPFQFSFGRQLFRTYFLPCAGRCLEINEPGFPNLSFSTRPCSQLRLALGWGLCMFIGKDATENKDAHATLIADSREQT